MRPLESVMFLVAAICVLFSATDLLAGPPKPGGYVECVRDGASFDAFTAGRACAVNKTCTSSASSPCACL